MSEHVTEWLSAYHDDELTGRRLHQVDEHLAACETCQAEFESLQGLSGLLHEVPAPEFTSPERFASQVNLLLPQRRIATTRRKILEVGWWMIPVGLLAVWVFLSTTILVSDVVTAVKDFGLLDNTTASLISGSPETTYWMSTLGQFGILGEDSLRWAETTEGYARNVLPQIVWQGSVALLYLTWIAIWWARHTRREQAPLLEG
jgi:hypothetical protein